MGMMSSLFVHKVVGVAVNAANYDCAVREQLLSRVGVEPDQSVNPKLMIQDTEYYSLCEYAAKEYVCSCLDPVEPYPVDWRYCDGRVLHDGIEPTDLKWSPAQPSPLDNHPQSLP